MERCREASRAHGAQAHLSGVSSYLGQNSLICVHTHILHGESSPCICMQVQLFFTKFKIKFNLIPIWLSLLFWLSLLVGYCFPNLWERLVGTTLVALIQWERPIGFLPIKAYHPTTLKGLIYSKFSKSSSVLFFALLQQLSLHPFATTNLASIRPYSSCTCCIPKPTPVSTVAVMFITVLVAFLHLSRGLFQKLGCTHLVCRVHLRQDPLTSESWR